MTWSVRREIKSSSLAVLTVVWSLRLTAVSRSRRPGSSRRHCCPTPSVVSWWGHCSAVQGARATELPVTCDTAGWRSCHRDSSKPDSTRPWLCSQIIYTRGKNRTWLSGQRSRKQPGLCLQRELSDARLTKTKNLKTWGNWLYFPQNNCQEYRLV